MKLKYYIRGVGVGILFTMFVFLVIIIPNLELDQIVSDNKSSGSTEEVSSLLGGGKDTGTAVSKPDPVNETADNAAPDVERTNDSTVEQSLEEDNKIIEQSESEDPEGGLTDPENDQIALKTDNTGDEEPVEDQSDSDHSAEEGQDETSIQPETDTELITAKVKISRGMTSEKFSRMVEENGIVASWQELNEYIVSKGYAKKIQTGEYKLSSDMSFEDICKIITQN